MKEIYLVMDVNDHDYDAYYDGVMAAFTQREWADRYAAGFDQIQGVDRVVAVQIYESEEEALPLLLESDAKVVKRREKEAERARVEAERLRLEEEREENLRVVRQAQEALNGNPDLARMILAAKQ